MSRILVLWCLQRVKSEAWKEAGYSRRRCAINHSPTFRHCYLFMRL